MRLTWLLLAVTAALSAENVLMKDSFPGAALDSSWRTAKGKWEVSQGAVKGTELAADKHAAVIRRKVDYRDAVIEFDFQLAGAQSLHLSLNHAKGHAGRVIITPGGFSLQKDTPAVPLARSTEPVSPNEWHTMRVTVKGRTMIATLDGKRELRGEHEALDVPKVDIGFPVKGDSAWIRNVRVTQ